MVRIETIRQNRFENRFLKTLSEDLRPTWEFDSFFVRRFHREKTMRRREFLQTIGTAPPAAVVGATTAAASTDHPGEHRAEPRVFLYDDGRHASPLYQFAPPLTPEDFAFTVDQLVDTGVDTLLFSAGLEGGVVQYDSRVAQKWGDNVDVWSHEIFYRASRNLNQVIADGHDPMKLLCDRCHKKGLWFLPTAPVCIVGADRARSHGYGRTSDFAYETRFQVGQDVDPRANLLGRFFGPKRLSFMHEEVRAERFRIFEELLSRYNTDGVELDLSIDNEFGPFCKLGEVDRLAPLLTEWIDSLREVASQAEAAQGRRKRIYVRIPAHEKAVWKMLGFDVPAWVTRKLVDGLICITATKKETPTDPIVVLDQDVDVSPAVELTRDAPCRVLAGFTTHLGRQLAREATQPMIWGAAANAYARGADGFGICNAMWTPNGWPWSATEYETLRLLGHPDLLATADKTYRALSQASGRGHANSLLPIDTILPRDLVVGEALEVPLRIADDLARWQRLGRVDEVVLRIRLSNFEPDSNRIRVRWNGSPLPDSILRRIDLHFRVIRQGPIGPYGYVLEYRLTPEHYPRPGDNTVELTLLKRDPKLSIPVGAYDVDCSIRYLAHRDFERAPIEY